MNSCYEIAQQIRSGKLTAEAVMQHFIKHAQLAHEKTNCITVFIKEALKEAQDLDKKIASGKVFPESEFPLLGVPVSVKDVFDMKGYPGVSGFKAYIKNQPEKDAACIQIIRECGGIPFCKTNVSQFTMTLESSNPVYGKTTHFVDANYTSGGSSSGEAVLIKLGGSVLGIGSDIGGSLRVPAHFCGIYTLKPTPQRIPDKGHVKANTGQEAVKLCVGPMANNVRDLKLFMKSLLDKQCWKYDETGIPLPFHEFKLTKPLKVGYIVSDGIFPASPACQRAILTVAKCLKSAGHEVFNFVFPELAKARTLGQALLTADQLTNSLSKLSGEGIDETIAHYVKLSQLPNLVKRSLSSLLNLFGQPIGAEVISLGCRLTLEEMWQVQAMRSQFREQFQLQWQHHQLDVIIMPPLATPAFKHGCFMDCASGLSYSLFANLLELPAGIVPVTHLSNQDKFTPDWLRKQLPNHIEPEALHEKLYAHACPDVPLPIGVQVVGMRFDDEKILSVMELIDDLLHKPNPSNFEN